MERSTSYNLALATAVILNTTAVIGCLILIGISAAGDPLVGARVAEAIRHSFRMFVVGAFLPLVITTVARLHVEISFNLSAHLQKWMIDIILLASGMLFLIAGWKLPRALMIALG